MKRLHGFRKAAALLFAAAAVVAVAGCKNAATGGTGSDLGLAVVQDPHSAVYYYEEALAETFTAVPLFVTLRPFNRSAGDFTYQWFYWTPQALATERPPEPMDYHQAEPPDGALEVESDDATTYELMPDINTLLAAPIPIVYYCVLVSLDNTYAWSHWAMVQVNVQNAVKPIGGEDEGGEDW